MSFSLSTWILQRRQMSICLWCGGLLSICHNFVMIVGRYITCSKNCETKIPDLFCVLPRCSWLGGLDPVVPLRSKKRVPFDRTVEKILAFHQNVISFALFMMNAIYTCITSNIGASVWSFISQFFFCQKHLLQFFYRNSRWWTPSLHPNPS